MFCICIRHHKTESGCHLTHSFLYEFTPNQFHVCRYSDSLSFFSLSTENEASGGNNSGARRKTKGKSTQHSFSVITHWCYPDNFIWSYWFLASGTFVKPRYMQTETKSPSKVTDSNIMGRNCMLCYLCCCLISLYHFMLIWGLVCSVGQCTAAIDADATQTVLSQSKQPAKAKGRRTVETYNELSGRQWLYLWVFG